MNPTGAVVKYLRANPLALSEPPAPSDPSHPRAKLRALVDDRVYGRELPKDQNQKMPLASIAVVGSGGASLGPGARGYAPWRVQRVDIFSYGKDFAEIERVNSLVYEVMTEMTLTVYSAYRDPIDPNDTVPLDTILKDAVVSGGPIDDRDRDTDWPWTLTVYDVSATPASDIRPINT